MNKPTIYKDENTTLFLPKGLSRQEAAAYDVEFDNQKARIEAACAYYAEEKELTTV